MTTRMAPFASISSTDTRSACRLDGSAGNFIGGGSVFSGGGDRKWISYPSATDSLTKEDVLAPAQKPENVLRRAPTGGKPGGPSMSTFLDDIARGLSGANSDGVVTLGGRLTFCGADRRLGSDFRLPLGATL